MTRSLAYQIILVSFIGSIVDSRILTRETLLTKIVNTDLLSQKGQRRYISLAIVYFTLRNQIKLMLICQNSLSLYLNKTIEWV